MGRYYIICFVFLSLNILGIPDLSAKSRIFLQQAKEYRKIGYLAYVQGDLEKAYQFFKKSLYLDPQDAVVHNDLGIIYDKRGLKELAEKEYLEAISLEPKYPPPYMNLALLYGELGRKEKVVFYLKERLKLGKRRDPWRKKAQELLQRYELSSSATSPRVKEKPAKRGDREAGVAEYLMEEARKEKFSLSQDKAAVAKTGLSAGKMHYEKGNYAQALEEFKRAQEWEPGNLELKNFIKDCEEKIYIDKLYREGKIALDNGDFALAIDKISQLLMLNPMYKDAEDILVSAEKERFIQETRQEEEFIILHIP